MSILPLTKKVKRNTALPLFGKAFFTKNKKEIEMNNNIFKKANETAEHVERVAEITRVLG